MFISFLTGIILSIMPLPDFMHWFRPQWLCLILLFWLIYFPENCGIGIAWLLGLLMDCVTGVPLGQHALIYAFLAYLVLKFHVSISNVPRWQQMGLILLLTIINLLLQKIILNTANITISNRHYWFLAVLSALCWPIVCKVLNQFNRKKLIY